MKYTHSAQILNRLWSRLSSLVLAVAAVACVSLFSTNEASALYILTGAADSAIILDGDAGRESLEDFSSKMLVTGNDTDQGGALISLTPGTPVAIRWNGGTVSGTAQRGENMNGLLCRLKVEPGPMDMILVDLSGDTVEVTVSADLTYYDRCTETVAYETERIPTADLPEGTEVVERAGRSGVRTAVYEVVYSGGELVSRQFVDEESSTAVNERILVGTGKESAASVSADAVDNTDRISSVSKNSDGSGTLTFRSGAALKFSAAKNMTATAYTSGYDGVGYRTASGTAVHVGSVAVDKNVIPLGTRLYIVSNDGRVVYGMAVAEDTGVRGNKVDLYYSTYQECINFGRRGCTVYILE